MKMLDSVKSTIEHYNMLESGDKVCVALSGGADSVSLLLALHRLGYNVCAVHINHNLRGEESIRDKQFCIDLCKKLNIELQVYDVDVIGKCTSDKLSIEAAAREIRYGIFDKYTTTCKVATAHTLNDCIETTLFNMSRGSGLKGLCGVPSVRGMYIRPLINTTREQLEYFLCENNQDYVTDSTNLGNEYTRNKLRHLVVPELKKISGNLIENYGRTRENIEEDMLFLDKMAEDSIEQARLDDTYSRFDLTVIKNIASVIRRRVISILLSMYNSKVNTGIIKEIDNIINNGGACQIGSNTFIRVVNNTEVVVETIEMLPVGDIEVTVDNCENYDCTVEFAEREVIVRELTFSSSSNSNDMLKRDMVYLDKNKVVGKITVRNRRNGDKVKLCNRDCTSTVKNLLKQKFKRDVRDRALIVSDESGIIFVEGYGCADRVKVDDTTKSVLEIKVS